MRKIFNLFLLVLGVNTIITSCDKPDDLVYHGSGTAPDLGASTVTVAPQPGDSNKAVLTLRWSDAGYATDSTHKKYIIQLDSAGKQFAHPQTWTLTGELSHTFLAKELNNILVSRGYEFNVPVTMEVRVVSSYLNNNEKYTSNAIQIKMTPYLVPPTKLYIVGSATAGGWGNPVPVPAQQFTKINASTFEGTFYMNGGGEYLLLPVNGLWAHKYAVADKTAPGLKSGGSFGYDLSDNFPGPDQTGFYKISANFQTGKYTVTQVAPIPLMYVPGDYQGWHPESAPALGSINADGYYEGYVNFPAGGTFQFKFTPQPDWSVAYGDAGGGTLSTSVPTNLTVPGAGFYLLTANTNDNTWSATATTWSLIGSFAASGWSNDVDMTYEQDNKRWVATITTADGDQFKFRANHDWGLNLGESGGTGQLKRDGDNIGDASKNFAVPAGTHIISLYLNNAGYYTYKIE